MLLLLLPLLLLCLPLLVPVVLVVVVHAASLPCSILCGGLSPYCPFH